MSFQSQRDYLLSIYERGCYCRADRKAKRMKFNEFCPHKEYNQKHP